MRIHTTTATDTGSSARTGVLDLPHGAVETPVFMPVGTAATVKAMHHRSVADLGYRLILGNTYHLYLRPGTEVIRSLGGLHGFSGWDHNILTDSGGFQVFSLSGLRKISDEGVSFQSHVDGSRHLFTPEGVVNAQVAFNSDIQMALDVCTGFGISKRDAQEALEITTRWASRARDQWREQVTNGYAGSLFGIVQGNFFPDLRRRSVEEIVQLDLPGIAIGGLSVGEEAAQFRETLFSTAEFLPADRPRYLMGIGTPDYIFDAVTAGIDMFDCVFPTRIARNGTVLTWNGRVVLRHEAHSSDGDPIDSNCGCRTCTTYSRAYLRHLFKTGEMLGPMLATEHNLYFLARLLDGIRDAIAAGRYVAYRESVMNTYNEGERARQAGR
ncbi:MAG TPA: tRNA guanosine(34) transglycosylase Tgt [Spirochaetia bacterium]|nr:tRNA guanosine(34) transglycosylase Tgt [Spirochaetia bacterium]